MKYVGKLDKLLLIRVILPPLDKYKILMGIMLHVNKKHGIVQWKHNKNFIQI
jgi:hypothetical protein